MPSNKLRHVIDVIEDFRTNAKGDEQLIFTLADDWDEENNLPIVDVSLVGSDGVEIFGDLNFKTFEDALIALAEALENTGVNHREATR